MRARRFVIAASSVAMLTAALYAIPAIATATMTTATTTSGGTVRVVPCRGAPVARPRGFVVACADSNWYLTGIHWVRWSGSAGVARATDHLNDCTPFCYDGTFHSVATVLVLSDPVRTPRYGELFSVATVLDARRLPGSRGATTVMRLNLNPLP